MSERRTRRAATLAMGAALGLALATGITCTRVPVAHAQTSEELKAARELFQEAYKDEQEKRYDAALDKFQRVAKVRESASVRYRIASVLESMGRLREARDAFRTLAASKPTLAANEQEIAASAEERANALDKRIPKLALKLEGTPPSDLEVKVDGTPVPAEKVGTPLEVEPGEHVVSARGTGTRPFESRVKLAEGGEVAMTVPVGGGDASGDGNGAGGGTGAGSGGSSEGGPSGKTLGIVGLAVGGALVVTSAVLLLVREGDISDLETACPGGACPSSRRSELESTRDQASLFGPLGVGAGVVGLAAAGFGAYMLLRSEASSAPAPAAPSSTTTTPAAGLRIRFGAAPLVGGGALSAAGTF